jgi:sugar/nucleoside kinase (ribokinase family)
VKGVKVVDTTGAGDAYAAGFLYAYTQGADLKTAGTLSGAMAAQVISQYGPRSEKADVLKLKASVL